MFTVTSSFLSLLTSMKIKSSSPLTSIQIHSVFQFIHRKTFFSLEFFNVKVLARTKEEGVLWVDNLNGQHPEVCFNTMPSRPEVPAHGLQGVFVAFLGCRTNMAAQTVCKRRCLTFSSNSHVCRKQSRARSRVFLAED